MAPMVPGLSHLANPLASPEQLARSASQVDGVPTELEDAVRYHACTTIQAAGILLRLPQQILAETIVLFTRFWAGETGGSLLQLNAKDVAAASFYLVTKPGPYPLSPRQVLNAFFYVTNVNSAGEQVPLYSEGAYQMDRMALIKTESQILRKLGYQIHVALPHSLCVNYLQTLDVLTASSGHELARRAHAHLNSALFSPQLLYLTHQPNALAVAAIYLGARETGTSLADEPWWEIFDVDREELGFLVVALTSVASFVESYTEAYSKQTPPMTAKETEAILSQDDKS